MDAPEALARGAANDPTRTLGRIVIPEACDNVVGLVCSRLMPISLVSSKAPNVLYCHQRI